MRYQNSADLVAITVHIGSSRATLTVTVGHARPGIQHGLRLIAAVERNSLAGLAASLTGGKLRDAVAELQ